MIMIIIMNIVKMEFAQNIVFNVVKTKNVKNVKKDII